MKNIGLVFSASRKMGVFQYGLSIFEALSKELDLNIYAIYFGEENPKPFLSENEKGENFIQLDSAGNNFIGKLKLFLNIILGFPLFITNKKNNEILKKYNLDLLIIPFPLMLGFENKIPYIVSIPDMMYRYYPGFPEYEFKSRIINDAIYGSSAKHSLISVVDSESGILDVNKFLHIDKEKIRSLPYLPPKYIYENKDMSSEEADKLSEKFGLPDKFIFYPAQFWYHKNHIRLVKALAITKEKSKDIKLVLAGNPEANKDNYNKIVQIAKELGVLDDILFLGYVEDKEMVALYKKATALVFTTLGGPTNIPPLEAMVLGLPVVYSGIFAMPDQMGRAGLAFDPFNEQDIADKINLIWENKELRDKLIKEGYNKMSENFRIECAEKWRKVVKEALSKI
jgi:glycosyltransferase involved in cell wall biosynthesis